MLLGWDQKVNRRYVLLFSRGIALCHIEQEAEALKKVKDKKPLLYRGLFQPHGLQQDKVKVAGTEQFSIWLFGPGHMPKHQQDLTLC